VWPGNNLAHADEVMSGCASGTSGPEVVYEFVPPRDGVLQASLETDRLLTLSVLRECALGSIGAPAECVSPNRQLVVPVTANDPVFVVIEGRDVSAVGPYELSASFREIACGDGARDQGEGCDDGNQKPGDGCSVSCGVELSEVEPNDAVAESSTLANLMKPFWGEISPAGDVDYIYLDLATDVVDLQISVEGVGDGACDLNLLDSVLRVFDHEGDELAFDDDGGSGFCSRVLMRRISAGRYAVRLEAAVGAHWSTFPYSLKITHEPPSQP
jgi:cysteine-rich repeat protein